MVEDVNNPENNVCFVLVGVTSSDARIDVSDVPTRYYQMGQTITCGSWADADVLRQRILDAKRPGRLLVVLLVVSALGLVPWNCLEIV